MEGWRRGLGEHSGVFDEMPHKWIAEKINKVILRPF